MAGVAVVATDLDGTLLRPDHTVSQYTRDILTEVVSSGRLLVFVTGRPPRWLPPVMATTGHDGVAVCANGAVVMDVAAEEITAHHTLPPGTLADLCAVIRAEMGPETRFGFELAPLGPLAGTRLAHEDGFQALLAAPEEVAPLGDLVRETTVVKVLARGAGHVADTHDVAARVTVATGDAVTVSHSSRTTQLLEIAPPGVTKASTLAELVAASGLGPEAVVAFGDMPNDIPLLSWAGVGVAVAGAHAGLLAVADAVTEDPEHDGVARYVAAHVLSGKSDIRDV